MQSEVTRVVLVQAEEDFQRNQITMLKEQNGQLVFHKKIDLGKLIEGEDLITKEESNG